MPKLSLRRRNTGADAPAVLPAVAGLTHCASSVRFDDSWGRDGASHFCGKAISTWTYTSVLHRDAEDGDATFTSAASLVCYSRLGWHRCLWLDGEYRSNPSRPGDGTLGIASEEVITPHAGVLGKPGSRPQIYCRVAQASHVLVLICKLGCARLTSSGDRRSRDCAFDRRLTIRPSSTIVVGALRRWRENRSLLPMLVTPDVPVGRVAYSGGACGRCIPVPTERSVRDQRRGC
jgi:hypothetical protein